MPTFLERRIGEVYKREGILAPHEIDIETICGIYDIEYHEKAIPSHYILIGGMKFIIVDSRLNEYEKREQFFHELGHILFHEGKQTSFPPEKQYLQEIEARRFSKYALIPFHMFTYIDFYSDCLVDDIVETFSVSRPIAKKRILNIKSKIDSNQDKSHCNTTN